jgi:hydrogenase expression/formation protein HypC
MCLGIPVKVIKKTGQSAEVEVDGVKRQANLSLRPEVKVGDYVLLHAGFVIEVLDRKEAAIRLKLLRQMADGIK